MNESGKRNDGKTKNGETGERSGEQNDKGWGIKEDNEIRTSEESDISNVGNASGRGIRDESSESISRDERSVSANDSGDGGSNRVCKGQVREDGNERYGKSVIRRRRVGRSKRVGRATKRAEERDRRE